MPTHAKQSDYRDAMGDPELRRRWRNRWYGMHQRCYNPKHRKFKNYGGRGITVCRRWHDVLHFLVDIQKVRGWDKIATLDLQIDRVDNSRGYSPDNVQIVTAEINNGHKVSTHHVVEDGRCATHFKRHEKLKAHKSTVVKWTKQGYTAEELRDMDRRCTAKTGNIRDRYLISYCGEEIPLKTFAKRAKLRITPWSVYSWHAAGLTPEQIVERAAQHCVVCQEYRRGYIFDCDDEPRCTQHMKEKLRLSCTNLTILKWAKAGLSPKEMREQDQKVVDGQGNSRAWIFFDYKGEKLCPSALCEKAELYVPFKTVARWAREGYTLEQILAFDELRRRGKNRPRT